MASMQLMNDDENMEDIRNNLAQLVDIFHNENTMVEYLKEKYERAEKEKQTLQLNYDEIKTKLDNAEQIIKSKEQKIIALENLLNEKITAHDSLVKAHEADMSDMKERLAICEREKYDVMLNIERYISEIDTGSSANPTFTLSSFNDREIIKCGKLIDYARNMLTMKTKLAQYSNELQKQQLESKKDKDELIKYRMNYWDRNMFHNLVMHDLFSLESHLSTSFFCFQRFRVERRVIERIKELLKESMASYV